MCIIAVLNCIQQSCYPYFGYHYNYFGGGYRTPNHAINYRWLEYAWKGQWCQQLNSKSKTCILKTNQLKNQLAEGQCYLISTFFKNVFMVIIYGNLIPSDGEFEVFGSCKLIIIRIINNHKKLAVFGIVHYRHLQDCSGTPLPCWCSFRLGDGLRYTRGAIPGQHLGQKCLLWSYRIDSH